MMDLYPAFHVYDERHVTEKFLHWRGDNKYARSIVFDEDIATSPGHVKKTGIDQRHYMVLQTTWNSEHETKRAASVLAEPSLQRHGANIKLGKGYGPTSVDYQAIYCRAAVYHNPFQGYRHIRCIKSESLYCRGGFGVSPQKNGPRRGRHCLCAYKH